jgi:hypothetical protein
MPEPRWVVVVLVPELAGLPGAVRGAGKPPPTGEVVVVVAADGLGVAGKEPPPVPPVPPPLDPPLPPPPPEPPEGPGWTPGHALAKAVAGDTDGLAAFELSGPGFW